MLCKKVLRGAVSYYLVRGEIRNNTANGDGGGVFVANNSAIEMTGGEMRENETKANGGGVFVASNSFFEMTGGEISQNEATREGGGVYLYPNAGTLFTMFGGEKPQASIRLPATLIIYGAESVINFAII